MSFIAENKKGISPGFLTLLAGVGGVLFLALILYSHFSSRSFYTNYFPLYKELGSIERSIKKGVIRLEEATADNHKVAHEKLSQNISSIPGRVDKVIDMLEVRQIDLDRDSMEGSIRSRLEELRKTTGDMAYLANRRLALAKEGGRDLSLNSRFGNIHAKVISQIGSINKIVENHFGKAISKADIAFDVVIGIWLIVVAGGMLTLLYFIRIRKSMEDDSERQLKLAKAISSAQECFIACDDYNIVFEPLIREIVELTDNQTGVICTTYGEADENTAGIEINALYERCIEGESVVMAESLKDGISKSHMLKRTESTRQLVCARPVDLAVLLTSLPRGIHTGYQATVIPFMKGTKVLGMLAVAGESGMYGAKMEQYLLPLTKTCTNIIDSTLRERINKELSENLDLAEKIFETINEGVMITDREGIVLFVNPAVYAITGFEAIDIVGQTPKVLRSGRHDEKFFREMRTDMFEKGSWHGEIWNRRRDGQPFLAKTNITAVYSEAGDIVRFISTFHDITDVKEGKEQIRFQALHDILTGLPNRRLFRDRLSMSISRANQNKGELALFFVSLDRFRKVNENLGHAAGDLLLQEVSRRITSIIAEGDTVGRWGGDEFLLALENGTSPAEADRYARRLISLFETPFEIDEKEIYISVSIGIALFPVSVEEETDQDALIRAADRAMSRAKIDHGNSVAIFNRSLDSADSEKMALENELRKALDRGELIVYYQPKVRLTDGRITGMEALSRWNHSVMGMISPGRFIPLAEETGLTLPIGENVLRDVVLQLGKWHKKGFTDLKVAVNLSALQFSQDDLPDRMLSILEPAGISPSSIDLEITEGMVIRNVAKAIETMRRLSDIGFTISVDDFGTGYSSLSYLKQFPLDTLKIDRSFVMDLPDDVDASAIVEAIISMAHSLGFSIVAEGVENEEQKEFLESRGCEEMQGFLFSQAVPPEEFTKLLEKNRGHQKN